MNQLSTDLPKLPTSAPPGKIKLLVLIYSLLVATINLFPAPSTPNRDLPFALASLIITLLFFIRLPFALRLLDEQKKATARAYADFQERTQEANLSLARELHDTVARHISLISLTAGQALTHSNPHPTNAALTAIDDSAHQALADLGLLIQTTRTGAAHTDVLRDPTITTDLTHSMTSTATALRNQGFTVVTDIRVQPGDIPTGIHPTIHKVIQEILSLYINTQEELTLIGTASNGQEAVRLAGTLSPRCHSHGPAYAGDGWNRGNPHHLGL